VDHRFKINTFIHAVVSVDATAFRFRQGVQDLTVPLAAVRGMALRDRGGPRLGVLASELFLRTERAPGEYRLRRFPWNPRDAACGRALDALRARLPAEADWTRLAWTDAAARLGVPAHPWHDALTDPAGMLGAAVMLGAGGAAALTGRLEALVFVGLGAVAVGIGAIRTRR
jgi:hypothetical protein